MTILVRHCRGLALGMVLLCCFTTTSFAVSGEGEFRRTLTVDWNPDKATGDELAVAEFYTDGHCMPNCADIHVSTSEGEVVASHILRLGPGDRVSVIFQLAKHVKTYVVSFGGDKPAAQRKELDDAKYQVGLHLVMRALAGGPIRNFQQMEAAWDRGQTVIGETMIDEPIYGLNPFGPQEQWISKITGGFFAPIDGEYIFSIYARDRGALYIDGNPTLFAVTGPADTRIRTKVQLKRGRHPFLFYLADLGGPGMFTVVWQRPDSPKFEVIPKTAFGVVFHATAGPLERVEGGLTADFTIKYSGECFYADVYSHRYHFAAHAARSERAKYEWDFGDGQTGEGKELDHVYLTSGTYPVTLTVVVGANKDAQTIKLAVSRDYEQLNDPPTDTPAVQAQVVATYDVTKMPEAWLPRAAWLDQRAGQIDAALAVGTWLAARHTHPDPNNAISALQDVTHDALAGGKSAAAIKLWETVPTQSDLQPRAGTQLARLLLWRAADFDRAVKLLKPLQEGGNEKIKRLYGEALVLDQKAEEGAKILRSLPVQEPPERRAAISGALARTIEYYIAEKDWETGESAWENWQQQFPADFLQGYSVMLQTRLIELKKEPAIAAKVAEAFARAVPSSSYAPQLLDRASKLLAQSNPADSAVLHQLLKDRYPEDPLAQ